MSTWNIREFAEEDEAAVISVWHRAGNAVYSFLPTWQALTSELAVQVFREVIRAHNQLWVGTENERIVAYLAMKDAYIDRLYVDPGAWRKGWGTRFIEFAKQRSPAGLSLHTHQENHMARALYEKCGFKAVRFGVSPPPESAPDVEYQWRPAATDSDEGIG